MKYNLVILLSNKAIIEANDGEIFLPTESEIMETLNSFELKDNAPIITEDFNIIKINEPNAIVWEEDNELKWYIGFILSIECPNSRKVEHFTRYLKGSETLYSHAMVYSFCVDLTFHSSLHL